MVFKGGVYPLRISKFCGTYSYISSINNCFGELAKAASDLCIFVSGNLIQVLSINNCFEELMKLT